MPFFSKVGIRPDASRRSKTTDARNERVPEEVNRRIVDHISDINLVYTEHARKNLEMEGINKKKIIVMLLMLYYFHALSSTYTLIILKRYFSVCYHKQL